jgi:hypothetical protein
LPTGVASILEDHGALLSVSDGLLHFFCKPRAGSPQARSASEGESPSGFPSLARRAYGKN